jgi:hypothetical protein
MKPYASFGGQVRRAFTISFLFAALLQVANACQCSGIPQSPCNSLSHSGVIFLGTVKSVENRSWSEFWSFSKSYSGGAWRERLALFRDEVIVNFSVEEIYKGSPARELSVRVGKFLGSCGFEYKPGELYFKKGEKYLVYAGYYGELLPERAGGDIRLRTNHCSGTTLASYAGEKINAYRALKGLQRPLVVGVYNIQPGVNKKAPGRGQTVTLVPKTGQRLTTAVQEDGSFLVTGVSPGVYTLAPSIPRNYRVELGNGYRIKDFVPVNPSEINVGTDSCTEFEVMALPDGKISGTVINRHGKPLSGATVRLWNADAVDGLEHWWGGEQTDTRGRFTHGPIAPGKYVVGVYVWSPDQEKLFLKGQDTKPSLWFYPGVARPELAKAITLGFAEHRSRIQIRVPRTSP